MSLTPSPCVFAWSPISWPGWSALVSDETNLVLLEHVAHAVANAGLRACVRRAAEAERMLVVVGGLLGVPDPELDVIPTVERHEVLCHGCDSTAVVAGVAAAAFDGETSSSERRRGCSLTQTTAITQTRERDDRRREERRMDRVGEADAGRARQAMDRRSLADADPRRQPVVDDHAHDRDSERRSHLPAELRQRCRRADLRSRHGVLHREHEHLHHRADADPGDDHVARGLAVRRRTSMRQRSSIPAVSTTGPRIAFQR